MSPERRITCARVQVLIEPYLDGDLTAARAARFESHLSACSGCHDELAAARTIRDALRALPHYACPETVTARVLQSAASQPRGAWSRLREAWREVMGGSVWRPAMAATGVAAVLLLVTLLSQQPRHNGYTAEELARAELEARWALAMVAQVTSRASGVAVGTVFGGVVRDVMGDQIFVPINDAVQKPLFNPPDEKESPE